MPAHSADGDDGNKHQTNRCSHRFLRAEWLIVRAGDPGRRPKQRYFVRQKGRAPTGDLRHQKKRRANAAAIATSLAHRLANSAVLDRWVLLSSGGFCDMQWRSKPVLEQNPKMYR